MRRFPLLVVVAIAMCGCAGSQLPECAQYPPDVDYAKVEAIEQKGSRWVVILNWHGYRTEIALPNKEATAGFPPVSDFILMTFVESTSYPNHESVMYIINGLDNTRHRVVFFCSKKS